MKYLKLFENWNEPQGDGFHFYDDSTTLKSAENILRGSSKPVKLSSEEIEKFEKALKKYLKSDILKLKLEYDPYKKKAINSDDDDWWKITPTSGPYDMGYYSINSLFNSLRLSMSCYLEKFEDDQYLLKLVCIPVPKDKYELGLVIHDVFGYIINGLDNLDSWVKASPIDTTIEAYKCLGSDRLNSYGQLKVYAPLDRNSKSRDNKEIEKLNKILNNYSFIQDYTNYNNGRTIYLFGSDHKQFGIIEDLTLHVADVKDIEMVSEKTGIPMDDFDIYK